MHLGNIDLIEYYHLDLGVTILHMLLMSYGGERIDRDETALAMPTLEQEKHRTWVEVKHMGIDPGDYRPSNFLWNPENQRVMLIDFERARYVPSMDKSGYLSQDSDQKTPSPDQAKK